MPVCLSRQDPSYDMHNDLHHFRSIRDLALRSNIEIDLLRSNGIPTIRFVWTSRWAHRHLPIFRMSSYSRKKTLWKIIIWGL